jgi:hypothetical protein
VRVLFLAHNLGKTRHFEGVIQELTARGHSVVITAAHKRNKPLKLGRFSESRLVDVVPNPVRRTDDWEPYVRQLRLARDYVRFFHPDYVGARKLAERGRAYAPPGWADRLERNGTLPRHRALVKRTLELAESLIPSEQYYELFIRSHAPDVVLVTPLIDFGSYQTDYVKSARRLGIPVVFLPFSWDNLTNRGLIRIAPDRTLVWNELQKREAVSYHDLSPTDVIVTGAPRFDDFFVMQPAPREEFCARAGLDASRPFLLYLCSSYFVAPDEVEFVRAWARSVRRDNALRTCGILVRPHPANPEAWSSVDFQGIENASVWTEQPRVQADPALYDSLHHAAAVVGLNTSAMIEAGILGKSVFTIKAPEFSGGQEQTLHFHHLLARNGGLVEVAQDLSQHLRQVTDALADPEPGLVRSRKFIESFVRPRGIDRSVAPIVVDEIELAAKLPKRRHRQALWRQAGGRVLLAALKYRRSAGR